MECVASYRARWVVPVVGPPVANGILVVHGERIAGIHRLPRADTVDLGDVAILPGLVNCHTHLEFSRLAQPLTPMTPFTDWIRRVVLNRQAHSEAGAGDAIRLGLRESLESGVMLLGEIATSDGTWDDYQAGPDCVVFQELRGLIPEAALPQAERQLHALCQWTTENRESSISPGVSPHAPYSVHPELFRRAIHFAQAANLPVAMHLAETESERELLAHGAGEFRRLLEDFGIWDPTLFGNRSWNEFLEPLSDLAHPLVIHGNYFDDDALRFLAQHPHLTLVYCPRTHAGFGHPPHPWRTLLQLGGSVALGTDSRASNPDLSLWGELQFLAERFPEISQLELLRLATINGARALGRARDHGSLETGKLANFIAIGPAPDDVPRLHQELITGATEVRAVFYRGRRMETAG
jgi:cytosine/adenosine deaminase-related metal-dependent hydrolase